MADVRSAHERERQLDAISTVLVLALLVTLALVFYYLSINGIQLPPDSPIAQYVPRVLLGGFTVMLLLYLSDQRRRLRSAVGTAVAQTESARNDLAHTVRWLTFSQKAATVLGTEGIDNGLMKVLSEAAGLFEADAAAVLGDDLTDIYIADGTSAETADRALMHVALEAAGRHTPLLLQALGSNEGQAIAVPLRVAGELRFVLCAWRRSEPFEPAELDSLRLMGRVVEMAIEREELLDEAQSQLEGTLSVLQYLVADKRPDYSRHVTHVADLANTIGRQLGLAPRQRKTLRLAGLIHDVGIMKMPLDMADASRALTREEVLVMHQHPRIGAEIALAANFDASVQEAIAGHHERMDGSGYPDGLRGDQTPLTARILAVCEVFDSMANRSYHGETTSREDALAELRDHSGTLYDAAVVKAFIEDVEPKTTKRFGMAKLPDDETLLAAMPEI